MIDLEREFLRLTSSDTEQPIPNEDTASDSEHPTRVSTPEMSEDSIYPKVLTLDVGGRKFKVSRDVLTAESGLFRLQLSERFTWTPESDGSYFLDADPNLFEHLLAFMRRPAVFPLFYTNPGGFNYDMYNRLEAEAEYFQIDALYTWIKDKKYEGAIFVHTHSSVTRDLASIDSTGFVSDTCESRHVIKGSQKIYLCPRQIQVHRGHPEMCGQACARAQAGNMIVYEDVPYLRIVTFKNDIIFDKKVCRVA
ncbi:hypothetical protein EJ07DRAFT_138660 [Lizonia empirigonia]|nr:hypothetical protein EJ07DRAFT_138660 [Lizonia empirigonia]